MKYPPINKRPASFWKSYTSSIKVIPKNRKHKKEAQVLTAILNYKITQAETCMRHKTDYAFENNYRLYRRGKNRCKNCGIKLEAQ